MSGKHIAKHAPAKKQNSRVPKIKEESAVRSAPVEFADEFLDDWSVNELTDRTLPEKQNAGTVPVPPVKREEKTETQAKRFPVRTVVVLGLMAAVIIAAGVGIWSTFIKNGGDASAKSEDSTTTTIFFTAETQEQPVAFTVPEENEHLCVISLILSDGTVIWKSDMVAPGEQTEPVILAQTLAEGCYENAILRYDEYAESDTSVCIASGQEPLELYVE